MTWSFLFNLFGLGCMMLSFATYRLFKPKTFYAPPHNISNYLSFGVGFCWIAVWCLSNLKILPKSLADDMLSIYITFMLVEIFGRAIWHHIETATRTPQELWAAFFGTDK